MKFEELKTKMSSILQYYEVKNVEPVLFTLSAYDTIPKVERDLEICNRIILGKEVKNWYERHLNYPWPDSEVLIEEGDDFVTISIDLIFDNDGDVQVPIWLFKSLLELVGSYLKLNGGLFYENHAIIERGGYYLGKRDGKWTRFYKSGKVHAISYFDEGKVKGTWEEFYESGRLKKVSFFDKGKPKGVWKEFYENGQLKSKRDFNFRGYRNMLLLKWWENGNPKIIWTTIISPKKEIVFKLKGITKNKWRLKPSQEVIELIGYEENGSIQSKNYFNLTGSLADGEHLYYDNSGNLVGRTIMENGRMKPQ